MWAKAHERRGRTQDEKGPRLGDALVQLFQLGQLDMGAQFDLVEHFLQLGVGKGVMAAGDRHGQLVQGGAGNAARQEAIAHRIQDIEQLFAMTEPLGTGVGGIAHVLQRQDGIQRRDGAGTCHDMGMRFRFFGNAEIAAGDLTAAQAKLQLLLDEKNVAKIGVDLKDGELEKAKSLLGEIVDAPLAASITADIDDGNFAAANKKLKDFIEEKRKAVALDVKIGKATGGVTLGTTSRAYSLLELKAFALGGFIPYGSGSDQGLPQGTTPALLHPNEAVIPLSNPTRIQQLFADPRISGPIEDALGPLDPLYGRGPTAADPGNWAVIASAQETKQKRDELYAVRDREMLDDLLKPVKGKAPDYWKAANTLQKAVDLRDALFAKKDAARAGELNKRKAARDALSAKSDQEEMDRLKAATDTTVDPNYWGAIATFSAHIAARDNLYAEKYDQELVNAQKFKIAAAEMAASQRANSQDNVGGTGVSRSSPSSSTPGYSSSSYSGKPAVQQHTHTWHVYGAERAFIMDIMREMDLIGREYK